MRSFKKSNQDRPGPERRTNTKKVPLLGNGKNKAMEKEEGV